MSRTKTGSIRLPSLSALWDIITADPVFRTATRGRKFVRAEKISLIFPDEFNAVFERRSLSYRTWFLNKDMQGGGIREQLCQMLSEDAYTFFEKTTEKCRALICTDGVLILGRASFGSMLSAFAASSSRFARGSRFYKQLERMAESEPPRALAAFMLCAALDEEYGEALETVFALWQIEKPELLSENGTALGVNHFLLGKAYYSRRIYQEADKEFRAATRQLQEYPEMAGELFCLLGSMRFFGQGRGKNNAEAEAYLRKSVELKWPDAAYPLFLLCRSEGRMGEALEALRAGVEMGELHCIRDLANACYHGNDDMPLAKSLAKARELYLAGSRPDAPGSGDPQCQYMLARICEEQDEPDRAAAMYWYEQAARNGSEEALRHLSSLTLKETLYSGNGSAREEGGRRLVVVNALSEAALAALSAYAGTDAEIVLSSGSRESAFDAAHAAEGSAAPSALLRDFRARGGFTCGAASFLLLSDDPRRNLSEALEVLDELLELKKSSVDGREIAALASRTSIWLRGRYELCQPMIDSAVSRLGDFFVPVYVCDDAKLASEYLLSRMPLFIPLISRSWKEPSMNLLIVGSHPGVLWLLKNAIAAAQIDSIPFSVSLISPDASRVKRRLARECPGIFKAERDVVRAIPEFFEEEDTWTAVAEALSGAESADLHLQHAVCEADYIAVYEERDEDGIELAVRLREWYLKTDPEFLRLPFIAVHCADDRLAWQTSSLTAGNERFGYKWFNNYQIECFGTAAQIYAGNGIAAGSLEEAARRIHRQFYTIENEADSHRADNDYFSRSYNRDSSRMMALSLPYRLFAAGFYFEDWRNCKAALPLSGLAEKFDEWLRTGDEEEQARKLEKLSVEEHSRWNRFMLTRGWMRAGTGEVLSYTRRGCTSHQLYIAKLHPFICSWEELGDGRGAAGSLQAFYNYVVSQTAPEKKAGNIREMDRQSVRNTRKILCGEVSVR